MTHSFIRLILFGLLALLTTLNAPCLAADPVLKIELGDQQSLELAFIPKGTFLQGSPSDENGREPDEAQREVELSSDFYIATQPVTVGQFRKFSSETGYRTEAEVGSSGGFGLVAGNLEQRSDFTWLNPGYEQTDDHPVTIVTVKDAIAFTRWLSTKANRKMVLPSEAQWEYACRAGTTTRFYSGDADRDLDSIGWHKGNSPSGPSPVGLKSPNAFGLFDMSGGVYEWCADIYAPYPLGDAKDPQQKSAAPGETTRVVLRGGSYTRFPKRCRSAARYRATAGTRNAENGFRVATLQLVATSTPAPVEPTTATESMPLTTDTTAAPVQSFASPTMPTPTATPSFPAESVPPVASSSFLSLLCPLAFLAGITTLFVLIVKAIRKPNAAPAPRKFASSGPAFADDVPVSHHSAQIEIADDGFWMSTVGYAVGTTLYFHYLHQGERYDSNCIVMSPDRQFVYTGVQPEDVHIDSSHEESDDRNEPFISNSPNMQSDATILGAALGYNSPEIFGQGSDSPTQSYGNTGTAVSDSFDQSEDRTETDFNDSSGFNSSSFPSAY